MKTTLLASLRVSLLSSIVDPPVATMPTDLISIAQNDLQHPPPLLDPNLAPYHLIVPAPGPALALVRSPTLHVIALLGEAGLNAERLHQTARAPHLQALVPAPADESQPRRRARGLLHHLLASIVSATDIEIRRKIVGELVTVHLLEIETENVRKTGLTVLALLHHIPLQAAAEVVHLHERNGNDCIAYPAQERRRMEIHVGPTTYPLFQAGENRLRPMCVHTLDLSQFSRLMYSRFFLRSAKGSRRGSGHFQTRHISKDAS